MTAFTSSAAIGRVSVRRGLLWSEHLYLLAAAVAVIVAVDPFEWRLDADPVVKHLALMIAAPAMVATFIGRALRSPLERKPYVSRTLRAAWPLLLLALMILGGSLHARLFLDIRSTFLNFGLYMLVTFGAASMVLQSEDPQALLRAYFRLLIAGAAVMGISLIYHYGIRQVYHEEIFLVIPIAVFFLARPRRGLAAWAAFAYFLSMSWFSHKYTSYIIGVLTVAYIALFIALPRMRSRSGLYRLAAVYGFFLAALAAGAVVHYVALHSAVELPTGNPEYRLHTYAQAWERFVESPLWGTFFTAEAVEKFTPFAIGIADNRLPTHSDILDLLANGGVVAMLLWVAGLAAIFRLAFRSVLHPERVDENCAAYGHTLAAVSIAGVFTYAFNPILLQPPMAYLLWTSLGLLLGLSIRGAAAAGDRRGEMPHGSRFGTDRVVHHCSGRATRS